MHETVSFELAGIHFEYDRAKEEMNITKHGISFRIAARVFFDYNYIEAPDDDNEDGEQRYDVIGDVSVFIQDHDKNAILGNIKSFSMYEHDILYVVYTERTTRLIDGAEVEVIRLISARPANDFERGLYYGKNF
jgi:uncharacterized DUF497 family protein